MILLDVNKGYKYIAQTIRLVTSTHCTSTTTNVTYEYKYHHLSTIIIIIIIKVA